MSAEKGDNECRELRVTMSVEKGDLEWIRVTMSAKKGDLECREG